MSDDGFVDDTFSPYSDFEDLLYDADPGPDLAEDLASHAVHSPVFADEPGYELLEHHSDWEYYSDDYYDDDPNILQQNPQDGTPSKRQALEKRGKKRKLADIDDIPAIDLGERVKLRDCIQGTVWAQPVVPRNNMFKAGAGEKVALLQDWKQRFRSTPAQTSGKSKQRTSQRDESWANDMSLADMGLLTERSSRIEQPGETNGGGKEDEDEAQEDLEGDEDYDEADEALDATAEALLDNAEVALFDGGAELAEEADRDLDMLPSRPLKRSRRTKDLLPSPPTSTESTAVDREALTLDETVPEIQKRGRGRPPKVETSAEADDPEGEALDQTTSSTTTQQKSKKRKASTSPPPNQDPTLANPRSKRIASTATEESIESKATSTRNTAPSTRSTRRKK